MNKGYYKDGYCYCASGAAFDSVSVSCGCPVGSTYNAATNNCDSSPSCGKGQMGPNGCICAGGQYLDIDGNCVDRCQYVGYAALDGSTCQPCNSGDASATDPTKCNCYANSIKLADGTCRSCRYGTLDAATNSCICPAGTIHTM